MSFMTASTFRERPCSSLPLRSTINIPELWGSTRADKLYLKKEESAQPFSSREPRIDSLSHQFLNRRLDFGLVVLTMIALANDESDLGLAGTLGLSDSSFGSVDG